MTAPGRGGCTPTVDGQGVLHAAIQGGLDGIAAPSDGTPSSPLTITHTAVAASTTTWPGPPRSHPPVEGEGRCLKSPAQRCDGAV